jgi:phospholipase C
MKVRVSRPLHSILLLMTVTLSSLLLLAGCGSVGAGTGTTTKPTVNISASPTSITAGQSSTLTVTATDATTVTIAGSDGSSYNLTATGGTQAVKPAKTTTYTATASGDGGSTTATATVTVGAGPTVTISANPTSVTAGELSTLTVAATNATTVTIAGSDGSSYNLAATGGTQTVKPAATTTYTTTATGATGTTPATATATVTVTAGTSPTVTITANPTSIAAGSSSTLTVVATNASQVTVTGSDNTSYTLGATGGTQAVTPAATTTYTATASGPQGSITATATVTVTGAVVQPTVTIAANPTTINAGSSSTLTVVATHATTVTIAGSDGTSYPMAATGGTQSVSPAANTTYTVTATSGTLTATATAAVTVVPAPPPPVPTVTISASPATIPLGSSSTLTVVATDATNVVLTGTDGSSFVLAATGGTETVSPKLTSTYSVTATGPGGTATATAIVTVTQPPTPTVTIAANPKSIGAGSSSLLTVVATNATSVTVTGTDGSSYTLAATGGTQSVSPSSNTTYTATADGATGTTPVTATATVTVVSAGTLSSINHVIFMMQENHSFDNYFGMLNQYRQNNGFETGDDGVKYDVDGVEDKINGEAYDAVNKKNQVISNNDKQHAVHTLYKFKSTCVDDMSSAWTESYGDAALGAYSTTRQIKMNGYVSNGDGFATSCAASGKCSGSFTDLSGDRTMGYYDQGFLNYYYLMASQFALSDRWFSPVSSKSIPNRIATFTGGTTQGLVNDPSSDDKLQQLKINNIFQELKAANVSWKVYYTVNNGLCIDLQDCNKSGTAAFPATTFSYLTESYQYLNAQKPCTGNLKPSTVVGDTTNSFCIDPTHIAPLSDATYGYFADLKNGTLPSFSFIEAGYGNNDEHPGSGQSILAGQAEVAKIVNALMSSGSWKDSVFFLGYDEGGGPYDHVPPVPGHTNDFTTASVAANYPIDISTISVSADSFNPCVPATGSDGTTPVATLNCDLKTGQVGSNSSDAAYCAPGTYCAHNGFGAQLGFRVPNMVISPFVRKHYVSHVPMDHTAIIKFVENRFIGSSTHLTARDAAQPNLLDFFDFTNVPWATPPTTPTPTPIGSSCQPANFH